MANVGEYNAYVTKIVDGDTIHTDFEYFLFGKRYTKHDVIVRFKAIDTPERGRPQYQDAKNHTKERLLGKRIVIRADLNEVDDWERLVGIPVIDGVDFCQELISLKLAREWYPGIGKWT
jgi:endonuclease YncB( thermonuclease family)